MSTFTAKRLTTTALAATAGAAALSFALVTGTSATAAAPQSVSGSPEGAFTRIADFYGSYIDAVYDGDGATAEKLRSFYLSDALQRELAVWEEANHANGVLRAQNVPAKWKVTSTGSGTGKTNATITLTWGSDTTQLHVQADLRTKKITSITD
ncbi:hypothetical protein OOK31_01700 [Streptomyces sp. NBC_00249]|uniref:hypothetical protein n=1 Tax=Streptomyces sp. NBC_00249 TaxID=2975690 RepID=UPI00225B7AB3|nr:hypothetical protein [Streptomyces sp. NBC_00249]MCX5192615.1 hypothetical protein [Streptomyces sp. NBC_00249]